MRTLLVKVKPNSPKTRIVSEDGDRLTIEISAPAEQNKANIELIKLLSKHFNGDVKILRGLTSKTKLIRVQ